MESKPPLLGSKAPLGVCIPSIKPGVRSSGVSNRIYTTSATVAEQFFNLYKVFNMELYRKFFSSPNPITSHRVEKNFLHSVFRISLQKADSAATKGKDITLFTFCLILFKELLQENKEQDSIYSSIRRHSACHLSLDRRVS